MTEFINEHTYAGHLGHLLIITAFVSSLAAVFSFIASVKSDELQHARAWRSLGRRIMVAHSVAVVSVVALLFFMIANHYFEYHYVWKYSSRAMEAKYIFSCFWSGQEGSLLLWSFWIVVLGLVASRTSGAWEPHIMTVVMCAQAFIFSLLLGVYAGDYKIGSSPFLLVRELPENASMPWARMNDYLIQITSLQDGVGLNPLLQNYWMTIHPPVLFLGFAATLFPFAFAVAGMARKDFNGWVKPAIPWSIFAVLSLGAGILLGGAWAYESLSFGGFWAWDPVENASLVPWILLICGLHALQIVRKRGRGMYLGALFCAAPFLLVLYSSFLTRSGILGESSVHSFTENGLSLHLLIFLLTACIASVLVLLNKKLRVYYVVISLSILIVFFFSANLQYTLPAWLIMSAAILVYNYEKYFAENSASMGISSKEVWIFSGILILFVSAVQITVSTSVPVINSIFKTNLDAFTGLAERNEYYHRWQVPIAIIICLLTGVSQFLQYRNTSLSYFIRSTSTYLGVGALIGVLLIAVFGFNPLQEFSYTLLVFAVGIAVALNAGLIISIWRSTSGNTGSAIAHIGFALIILGAVVSGAKRTVLSKNTGSFSLIELNKDFKNDENILLRQGDTLLMKDYFVSYRTRHRDGINLKFQIDYYKPYHDARTGRLVPGDSAFSLYPTVQINDRFGNVSEPGTKHFIDRDIFTHIKYADLDQETMQTQDDDDAFMGETSLTMTMGKPVRYENFDMLLKEIYLASAEEQAETGFSGKDIVVKAILEITNRDNETNSTVMVNPIFVVQDSVNVIRPEIYSEELDARIRILELSDEENTISVGISQREYVVMQAHSFPGMNILWAGCVLMLFGCAVALKRYVVAGRTIPKETRAIAVDPVAITSNVKRNQAQP